MSAKFKKIDSLILLPNNKPIHPDDVAFILQRFEDICNMDCVDSLAGDPKLLKKFKKICKKFMKNEITIDEFVEELDDSVDD
jgi:hypothetical protein